MKRSPPPFNTLNSNADRASKGKLGQAGIGMLQKLDSSTNDKQHGQTNSKPPQSLNHIKK